MRQRMDFEDLFIYDIWTRVLHEGWMTYRCWPRQAQKMLRWNGSKRLCQTVIYIYILYDVYMVTQTCACLKGFLLLPSNLSNRYEQHACHRCRFWCFSMFRRPLPSGSMLGSCWILPTGEHLLGSASTDCTASRYEIWSLDLKRTWICCLDLVVQSYILCFLPMALAACATSCRWNSKHSKQTSRPGQHHS